MSLKDKITADLTTAMKAKDTMRTGTLRMVKAALMNEQNKRGVGYELTEDEAMKTLLTLVKQRKDSIDQYVGAGRDDLAEKEKLELDVIEVYLPKAATAEEIADAVDQAISGTGATSIKDMGAVMKGALAILAGKNPDGKLVSETVKAKLQG